MVTVEGLLEPTFTLPGSGTGGGSLAFQPLVWSLDAHVLGACAWEWVIPGTIALASRGQGSFSYSPCLQLGLEPLELPGAGLLHREHGRAGAPGAAQWPRSSQGQGWLGRESPGGEPQAGVAPLRVTLRVA